MNDLMNPFGQPKAAQSFDKIQISIAHQNESGHGLLVKSRSQRPSIIGPSNLRKMGYSAPVFLVLYVIMSVCAANISE